MEDVRFLCIYFLLDLILRLVPRSEDGDAFLDAMKPVIDFLGVKCKNLSRS